MDAPSLDFGFVMSKPTLHRLLALAREYAAGRVRQPKLTPGKVVVEQSLYDNDMVLRLCLTADYRNDETSWRSVFSTDKLGFYESWMVTASGTRETAGTVKLDTMELYLWQSDAWSLLETRNFETEGQALVPVAASKIDERAVWPVPPCQS